MKTYEEFCTLPSLYAAWTHVRRGRRARIDIVHFERRLEEELCGLAADLAAGTYQHGPYQQFLVRDPKPRVIHKATVRDRVIHRALFDVLYPVFEPTFIFDSYAARTGKGTLAARMRIHEFVRRAGRDGRRQSWVLHGDVADFFGAIDHAILGALVARRVADERFGTLSRLVIQSFATKPGRGLPLGNLTSQIFANVYLHELDHFVKHTLRVPFYVRYNDDVFVISEAQSALRRVGAEIQGFCAGRLALSLPARKLTIRALDRGVDTLGTVLFPWGSVPRARVRRALLRQAAQQATEKPTTRGMRSAVSRLGFVRHSRSFLLQEALRLASRI